ncbi:hypothetical protein GCM10027445_62010 [Amycolatopsis endophytica]|uniref:beta-N-acetylhexosaminidase n=1 Tax=Amycolatopsis endophytica TaxID=860233 RepID=A0A853AZS3_9PSEU|nr:glycoside hydrolase family 20 zincin-like fold domain-containing protein [Amycolatopsis endophytica]NYI88094.1 hypothetical protein [Amycolatopsis endophytica]
MTADDSPTRSRFPALIPQPHTVIIHEQMTFPCVAFMWRDVAPEVSRYVETVRDISGMHSHASGVPVVPIDFATSRLPAEHYRLELREGSIRVEYSDPRGALHAIRTLVDVWDGHDRAWLPVADIEDGPELPVRGVFIESFAGTDLMELSDWQNLIDRLSQLKLNTMGLSIYGCWDIRHGDRPAEYLFTPLAQFPELRTTSRITTWDPDRERECDLEYVPVIFEQDLFADICGYAADRGVEVVPHLGGPGHSTLIPRVVTELSAVGADGDPTGYGYCLSRTDAREALRLLIRNLVDQHLRPNGIRRLHVAGDEYYPIRNVDPRDRERLVSPYCVCEGCRNLGPGELLVEYLVLVGAVLADYGIEMVHWHDTLVREGVLDTYLDRIEELGLPTPAIVWWKYNDPVPEPFATRVETWVAPTTGLFPHLFAQDFTPNISTAVRKGVMGGATGTLAYWIPDVADHQNVACLADLSWNYAASGGAVGFRRRWSQYVSPASWSDAEQAYDLASTVSASYPTMMYLADQILPYFADSGVPTSQYPDDLLVAFSSRQPPVADALRQVAATLREATTLMPRGGEVRYWANPLARWQCEMHRTIESLELFLDVLRLVRRPDDERNDSAEVDERARALLRHVGQTKPGYLAPAALREHWLFVREIAASVRRLRAVPDVGGQDSWHPWIV